MWDWERASVPYRPIYRRRLLRRRFLTVLLAAAIAIPYYLYHHHQATQSIGERIFDEVTSTVSVRYFDASYHGVAWQAVAEHYRPLIANAPTTQARYAALRSMLAQLHDSHTAVYSPTDLEPLRDREPACRVRDGTRCYGQRAGSGLENRATWRRLSASLVIS